MSNMSCYLVEILDGLTHWLYYNWFYYVVVAVATTMFIIPTYTGCTILFIIDHPVLHVVFLSYYTNLNGFVQPCI